MLQRKKMTANVLLGKNAARFLIPRGIPWLSQFCIKSLTTIYIKLSKPAQMHHLFSTLLTG